VISEPVRPRPDRGVAAWFAAVEEADLYVSVLSLGEIRNGITRLTDAVKQARLETFLSALSSRFRGHVLPVDAAVAEHWGRLTGGLAAAGTTVDSIDSLIAATALHHDLSLVTRNEKGFRFDGLVVINPFTAD
jgi:predicted nucleic acid-binding protein